MFEASYALFFLIAGLACLTALGFGIAALNIARWDAVLARYPLQILTWIIATPFFGLSAFGAFLGLFAVVDGEGLGFLGLGLVTLLLAALCILPVVMCSRAARGKFAHGPVTPAILGFGVPALASVYAGLVGGTGVAMVLFGVLVAAGAGVNGLLAIPINERRRAGQLPGNANAPWPSPSAVPADAQALTSLSPLPPALPLPSA